MRLFYFIIILFVFSCKSIDVREQCYKTSNSKIELGALGEAKSISGLKNSYTITAFPNLNEKLKLDIAIVPFTKKANKIYQSKAKFDQKQIKVNYADSLPVKPEMVSIKISDIASLINDLNSSENSKELTFIKNNERTAIVTSVLVVLNDSEIQKLRNADTYYLVQSDVSKHTLAVYKQGKKIETIDLSVATVIGYTVGKFCWSENERGKWQIGDIIQKGNSCKGNTYRKVKPKKEKSLYKM